MGPAIGLKVKAGDQVSLETYVRYECDVIREQKTDESEYRFGYQEQFAEKDKETGWSHFELREYDPIVGRWTATAGFAT